MLLYEYPSSRYVARFFGLSHLLAGWQSIEDDSTGNPQEINVISSWIATHRLDGIYPTIASVKTNEWHRGLILVPPMLSADFEVSNSAIRPIDLTGWDDPIRTILQHCKLYSEENLPMGGSPQRAPSSFVLQFSTPSVSAVVQQISIVPHDPEINKFAKAIWEAFIYFVEKYKGDDLVNEFLTTNTWRNPYSW